MHIQYIKSTTRKALFFLLGSCAVLSFQISPVSALPSPEGSLIRYDSRAAYQKNVPIGPVTSFFHRNEFTLQYSLVLVVVLFIFNFFALKKQQDETKFHRLMLGLNIFAAIAAFIIFGMMILMGIEVSDNLPPIIPT